MNNKACGMCGASIDANATVCPICGFQQAQQPQAYQLGGQQPVQQQPVQQSVQQPVMQQQVIPNGMARIDAVRPGSFFGIIANMVVSMDGANPQQLANDQTVTYDVAPGQHVLSYKIWSRRRKEYTIMAEPGKHYRIVFTPDWLWGGFKINNDLSTLK